jgi:hypothetical protein
MFDPRELASAQPGEVPHGTHGARRARRRGEPHRPDSDLPSLLDLPQREIPAGEPGPVQRRGTRPDAAPAVGQQPYPPGGLRLS